jgi:hypothetical protein
MRFIVKLHVRCLSSYSVTLYSVQQSKVGFSDDVSLLRSGDAEFESEPGHGLFD